MATYDSGPLLLRTQVRYIGDLSAIADDPSDHAGRRRRRHLCRLLCEPSSWARAFELFGGIDNAFDEEPPLLESS